MTPITRLERDLAFTVIAASLAVFLGLLLVVSPLYVTFDEAKYLGLGHNFLTGHGPRTLFGNLFLPHSPLWAAIVVAPSVWIGIDPLAWGHVLNAAAAAGLLLLVAALGWQIRPAVGGLAVAGYLAVPYLHDLTRTARLDVPTAMFMLLYIWIGLAANTRASVPLAVAAGCVFAIGFLVKETVLVLAPVPFLFAIFRRRPWPTVVRLAAVTFLVALVGTSWWFLLFAQMSGRVYRLGTPAWTLAPLAVASAVLIVAGLGAPWLVRRLGLPPDIPPRFRTLAAWGLTAAWTVALLLFLDRNGELKGHGLFQPTQWALYLGTWLVPEIRVLVVYGLAGVLLALVAWWRGLVGATGYALHFMITICSVPLILFVIATGEPPRNYLAQIGVLAALAAAGWFAAAEWIGGHALRRVGRADPMAAGLPRLWLTAGFAAVLIGGSLLLARHALTFRESPTGLARATTVREATGWILANVEPQTPIGFGSFLGYEMSLELRGRHPMVQTVPTRAVLDPSAKYGFAPFGERDAEDWIAVDVAPRAALEFHTYRASTFTRIHRRRGTRIFVYTTATDVGLASLVRALTSDHGFTELVQFRHMARTRTGVDTSIEARIYAVDPARMDFATGPFYMTPEALDRLIGFLQAEPARASRTARHLLERAEVVASPDTAESLRLRLAELADG